MSAHFDKMDKVTGNEEECIICHPELEYICVMCGGDGDPANGNGDDALCAGCIYG